VSRARLRVCLDSAVGGPSLDTAVSRAVLQRVDAGELPATLRLSRPPRVVAFSSRDARSPAFPAAMAAARAQGFDSVLRLAGGRAAVFTEDTIAFAWAVPVDAGATPADGIDDRFQTMAGALRDAFAGLGVDSRIGQVPGEYCPGTWSVNARGETKLAGIGQRLLKRAAHTGGVVVVGDGPDINAVLTPVYAAMGVAFDPRATGQLRDEVAASWDTVRDAIVTAFASRFELEPWSLDEATLALGRDLAAGHLAA
jgi:octanoyl-[GcvH]:protein N-octanoyltransferase